MAQFVEFVGNNVILVGIWFALVVALVLHRSKTSAQAVSTQQAVMLINRKDGVILDIRDKKDHDTGHIVDSIHIPLNKLAGQLTELGAYKSRPIIVVCKMGQHSGDACKTLLNAGFSQTVRLRGGMAEWKGQNLPVVQKGSQKESQKQGGAKDKAAKGKGKARKSNKSGKTAAVAPVVDQPPVDQQPVTSPAGDSPGAESPVVESSGLEGLEERRVDEAAVAEPEFPRKDDEPITDDNDSAQSEAGEPDPGKKDR